MPSQCLNVEVLSRKTQQNSNMLTLVSIEDQDDQNTEMVGWCNKQILLTMYISCLSLSSAVHSDISYPCVASGKKKQL